MPVRALHRGDQAAQDRRHPLGLRNQAVPAGDPDPGVVDTVLDGIDGALATATHPEELALVRKEVLSHTGGMAMLNETVKLKLREWFQSQGGIRVAKQSSGARGERRVAAEFRPGVTATPVQFEPVPLTERRRRI